MSEEELNKPTKYFIVIGLVVTVVVLFFLLRPSPVDNKNIVDYNYFKFEEIGGLWQTDIQLDDQLYEAAFRFNPTQVEDVYMTGNFSGFKQKPIYLTFDPTSDSEQFKYLALAASEMTLHIVRALNFTVEAACTKNETDACVYSPIVTCSDNASVIYLSPSAPTQITLAGDCVTLSGEGMDLLKSVDRLLFQWYKIMR